MGFKKYIKWYLRYTLHNSKKYWDIRGGVTYFNLFHSLTPRNEEIFIKNVEKYKPSSIIDIGCGYGRYLKVLNEKFPKLKLVGVDISLNQLNMARDYCKNNSSISFFEIDGKVLPFEDNSFDMAITYGCLSAVKFGHIKNFLKEIQRVTKQYGVFLEYYNPTNQSTPTKYYWYKHDYEKIFKKSLINLTTLNENGDTLFLVKY